MQHQILWLYLVIQTWLLRGTQTPGAASPPSRHSPPDAKGAAAGTRDPPTRLGEDARGTSQTPRAYRRSTPRRQPRSGKTREAREVTLRVPCIRPAHFPFAEGASDTPVAARTPRRARGTKRSAGSSPTHPERARGNVSRLQAERSGLPRRSNKPSAAGAKASPRPEGARTAPALSPFKPLQPPPPPLPPPRYPSPDGRRSSSFRAPRDVPPLGGARGGAAMREGASSGSGRLWEDRLPSVRQGAAEGSRFRLRLGEGLGGLVRGREDCAD